MFQQHFWLILGLIGSYFLVLLGLVVKARIQQTGKVFASAEEYFLARRNLSTPVLVATYIGTLFSTFTIFGVPSAVYANGIGVWLWLMGGAVINIGSLLLFIRGFHYLSNKYQALSPIEVITKAYDSKLLGGILAVLILIFLIPLLSVQLVGIGKLLQAASGGEVSYLMGVGFIMSVIMLYLIVGGVRAVAYTDFFQAILIFVGIIGTVTFYISLNFTGLSDLFQQAQQTIPDHITPWGPDGRYTLMLLISSSLFVGLTTFGQPQRMTRFMMAKNHRQIMAILLFTAIFIVIGHTSGTLLGLAGKLTFPDLAEPSLLPGQIMASLMEVNIFTLTAAGMLLVGVIAASMSTADSLLLAIGQLFTRDVAKPLFKLSQGKQILGAKLFMLLVLGCAFVVGMNPPRIILDLASYTFMGTSILAPVIIAAGWRYRSKLAAFTAVLFGEGVFIALTFLAIKPLGFMPSFWGLVLSTVIVLGGGWLQRSRQITAAE